MYMDQATLSRSGRSAIAKAIASRPLHLAWGAGLPEWDDLEYESLPSLYDAESLVNELGRRKPTIVGFVELDEEGSIVIPVKKLPDGSIEYARYSMSDDPTPFLYVRVDYDFENASEAVIRELAVFMDTETANDLPPGQMYFTPDEITNRGQHLAGQYLRPPLARSAAMRQSVDFVLPI